MAMDAEPVISPGDSASAGDDGHAEPGRYRPGYEVVAEQILQFIAELEMSPGDRMPTEKELAARLGASRTVVREAIKILSATGRVSAQRGRGLYVADGQGVLGGTGFGGFFIPTNLDHIFMLFEFRRVQEIAASRLAAAQASPAELRVIEAAVQTCRHGHQSGDLARFEAGDDAFHLAVAAASHNFFLVAAVREARRLQRQASVIGIRGVGGHAAEAVEEHDAIYRAIRDGRPDAAAEATVVHLDNTLLDYRREIQRRVFGENLP
ncbi:FadR family transcriptional regulator [Streptosporangiaceae bacterium NEAU-GS5]|nr:FadR family transcriptional regulator [Streptosporangiaceae bacterium NEAU-GS5]